MRTEVIRAIADWLKDPDSGVNALLPVVPRDLGDSQPPDVTIADETRDAWVARRVAPRDFATAGPYLMVSLFEETQSEGQDHLDAMALLGYQTSTIAIAIRYVGANSESDVGNLMGGLTMRAVRGSLMLLNADENLASRERNGVRLDECMSINEVPVYEKIGDIVITCGVLARYNITDVIPLP